MDGLTNFKDYFNQIRKNIILNNYYTKEIKDGKTLRASVLDWIFIALIISVFFMITIFNSTKNITISIILTIILMMIYLFVFGNLSKLKKSKKIDKIKEDIRAEEIIKEIEKLDSEEYLLYIKELLEKYYNTVLFEYNGNIDFIGEINGEDYGIKCFKNSIEDKVNIRDIKSYDRAMEINGMEYGIIITNSYFHESLKEYTDCLLIDFNHMKDMLKEIGKCFSDEEIEELIISNYKDKRRGLKKDLNINKIDKIYKFVLLGIVLYLGSFFTSYSLYYKIMGIILIFVGTSIGIYKLIQYFKLNARNRI